MQPLTITLIVFGAFAVCVLGIWGGWLLIRNWHANSVASAKARAYARTRRRQQLRQQAEQFNQRLRTLPHVRQMWYIDRLARNDINLALEVLDEMLKDLPPLPPQ